MIIPKHTNYFVVNYHYLERDGEKSHASHPTSPETFSNHLAYLKEHFAIVDIPTLFSRAKENGEPSVAITFDDGLRGQYLYAPSLLEAAGGYGTFFIIANTFENYIPATHKIHILLSRFPASDLLAEANRVLPETAQIPLSTRISETRKLRDDIPTANFKEALHRMEHRQSEQLLDTLFASFGLNAEKISEDLFMNKEEVLDLHRRGHTIGGHGSYHLALDTQTSDVVAEEISHGKKVLSDVLGESPKVFSYPHGGANETVAHILKSHGFTHAVTIKQAGLSSTTDPFFIPRFDAKDLSETLGA
ncbi:hypothetical protein COU17_02735 [Candidatus Kaiserbacteria bacterium CG10_big_fil_rev_8_21_14_0_10_49_17]|uniref:NodB homology domain-containing protein n=1 Tax=Candidatus Kaiserbacteria bacterium CG10_big_fil_rev_8_21_14_0_10_49_17 TaxID=1974609 RepID=A0A2M6WDW2_9BACT|nr:MAG: hypothetical protein COU17_02735 [Candidatus Kaiserbacteria bacterium CG10_big_fil_rev_8_21_14_0_10_49_17]